MGGLGPSRALHSGHTGTAAERYVRFPHLVSLLARAEIRICMHSDFSGLFLFCSFCSFARVIIDRLARL